MNELWTTVGRQLVGCDLTHLAVTIILIVASLLNAQLALLVRYFVHNVSLSDFRAFEYDNPLPASLLTLILAGIPSGYCCRVYSLSPWVGLLILIPLAGIFAMVIGSMLAFWKISRQNQQDFVVVGNEVRLLKVPEEVVLAHWHPNSVLLEVRTGRMFGQTYTNYAVRLIDATGTEIARNLYGSAEEAEGVQKSVRRYVRKLSK